MAMGRKPMAEVATPIMDRRPVPPSAEDRARMLQPEDLGRTIRFVAEMPAKEATQEKIMRAIMKSWEG